MIICSAESIILQTSDDTKHWLCLSVVHTALGLFSEEAGGAGGREGKALYLSQSLSTYGDGTVDRYVMLYSSPVNTALCICTSHEEWLFLSILIFRLLERLLLVSESVDVQAVATQHEYPCQILSTFYFTSLDYRCYIRPSCISGTTRERNICK